MRALACAAVVVVCALGASACGGGSSTPSIGTESSTSTVAIQLYEPALQQLSPPLRKFVGSLIEKGPLLEGTTDEIDVYGPGSRVALSEASSGESGGESARQAKERFYLIVLHGNYVCGGCSVPAGAALPRGTIATMVWSPQAGGTDGGISDSLPSSMWQLNRLAQITLS